MVQASPGRCSNRHYSDSECCDSSEQSLRLALLGCETNEPYGPIAHTAELFLSLLDKASKGAMHIVIEYYNVKEFAYPGDWDIYDGIIVPGSFSAAYDPDPWIQKLKTVLQEQLVEKNRPTLGICFGHQVIAHSFENGQATATPSGARGGRFVMDTKHNWVDTNESQLNLYFTHGDMVAKLPNSAVCLGGDNHVPIQAAAYFASVAEKEVWVDGGRAEVKPIAVTFQAHPEYATCPNDGVERTLCGCLKAQASKGLITNLGEVMKDCKDSFADVSYDSVKLMSTVMTMLGWQ